MYTPSISFLAHLHGYLGRRERATSLHAVFQLRESLRESELAMSDSFRSFVGQLIEVAEC